MNSPTPVPGQPTPDQWPAGWYLDHRRPGWVQLWDGQQMTGDTRQLPDEHWHYVDPAGWTFDGGRLQAADNVEEDDDRIVDHLLSPVGLIGLLIAAGTVAAVVLLG